ncbi:MAG: hypothetical protein E7258_03470 [Lachnospiraceae bacterium]|nr:hypothetical protein [Lachnospiraceae bacterium]
MSYRVGILDKDLTYSYNLMEYFNNSNDIPIRAMVFSEEKALVEYSEHRGLDLILIGEDSRIENLSVPFMYMCEYNPPRDKTEYIFKYQPGSKMSHQIREYLKTRKKDTSDMTIYGIYSPLGRVGKTAIAKGICHSFGQCLYIGMEEYPSIVESEALADMFFYYLAEKNPKIIDILDNAKMYQDKVRYISGVKSYMDFRQITFSHMEWLCNTLKSVSNIKQVVFDIGQAVLPEFDVFLVMNKLIIPILEDEISKSKLKIFKEQLGEYSNISDRVIYVDMSNYLAGTYTIEELIKKEGL